MGEGQEAHMDALCEEHRFKERHMKKKKQKEGRKQSKTLRIHLPENQWQVKEQLTQLADLLGCSIPTLIWYSIEQMLRDSPIVAPKPVTKSTRGFWVIVTLSIFREIVGVEVKEVIERISVKVGRYFFRYEGGKNQTSNRANALEKAISEAQQLAITLGLDTQTVTTNFFNSDEACDVHL